MPTGTVTAVGVSRSGKPTVSIDGKIYSASKVETGSLRQGDRIEFDSASSVFNGATVWFLNKWTLVEGATKYPQTGATNVMGHQQSIGEQHPWPIVTKGTVPALGAPVQDVERPCISNWGAEAIKAGLIKDPADLGIWVNAMKVALRTDSTFSERDTDIP